MLAESSSRPRPIRWTVAPSCGVPTALRKAGIQGANWHTLRHTAASRRVMAGVDLVSVKKIMGHRNIETTLRYSHCRLNIFAMRSIVGV